MLRKTTIKKSLSKSRGHGILVGIDEAGRGPLAGPLSLGLIALKNNHKLRLTGLRDSKKLSHQAREIWFQKIEKWQVKGELIFTHTFIHANVIDKRGLAWALSRAVQEVVKKARISDKNTLILLDAGLKAPPHFTQESIVKGDEKIPVIALASIVAKVIRDRYMMNIAKRYPEYGFDIHKGYGTKNHLLALKRHGPSTIHRRSFLAKKISISKVRKEKSTKGGWRARVRKGTKERNL